MNIRFWWKILFQICMFACSILGSIWSAIQILDEFCGKYHFWMRWSNCIWILIVPSVIGGFMRAIYLLKNNFFPTYKLSDKTIRVRIGDILDKSKGNIIVGINAQLETDEQLIAPSSIHAQLLKEKDTNQRELEKVFEKHKKSEDFTEGFFQETIGGKKVIFLIMSCLSAPGVAYTSVELVKEKLYSLFSHQQKLHIENNTVFCPLLGTGETGIYLSKEDAVLMIVKIFLRHCKVMDQNSTDKIKHLQIIVCKKDSLNIDWIRLNMKLKGMIEKCNQCEGFNYI